MPQTAAQHFRPTRTPDGEGGFWTRLSPVGVLYCDIKAHEGETTVSCRSEENTRIGDVLRVPYERTMDR